MAYFGYFPGMVRRGLVAAVAAFMVSAAPGLAQTNTQPQTSTPAQSPPRLAPQPAPRAVRRAETVDQRIAALHRELKITPAEETDWQAVAQVMRNNAATMEKLVKDKSSRQNVTALEDLQTYQDFAQAHLDGVQKLTAAFQVLYNEMPDDQKKLADQAFRRARQQRGSRPG